MLSSASERFSPQLPQRSFSHFPEDSPLASNWKISPSPLCYCMYNSPCSAREILPHSQRFMLTFRRFLPPLPPAPTHRENFLPIPLEDSYLTSHLIPVSGMNPPSPYRKISPLYREMFPITNVKFLFLLKNTLCAAHVCTLFSSTANLRESYGSHVY
jgi:hypothetical protein